MTATENRYFFKRERERERGERENERVREGGFEPGHFVLLGILCMLVFMDCPHMLQISFSARKCHKMKFCLCMCVCANSCWQ